MNKGIRKSEKGQVVIILVVAMVGLLGFVALSVDVGMIYADRRFAQNAADASALAGAALGAQTMENSGVNYQNFDCDTLNSNVFTIARDAAKSRATSNSFTLENTLANKQGVEVICTDNVWTGSIYDKYIDVHVIITSTVKTGFAHLFYSDPIKNTVEAVSRVRPRHAYGYGYAIASLSPDCPNQNQGGVTFDGDNTVLVHNGGVFSSSCLRTDGGVTVIVDPPENGINYLGTLAINGSGSISPAPQQVTAPLPPMDVPVPACASLTPRGSHTSGSATLFPGSYTQIKVNAGETVDLRPGLYCMSGNFTGLGGSITGTGITIVMESGDFNIGGNVEIDISAPTVESPPAILGMLIYMPNSNTGSIELAGTSGSSFVGTVYTPTGQVDVGGTTSVNPTYNTEIIAYTVKVHGNALIEINFDTTELAQNPAALEMEK